MALYANALDKCLAQASQVEAEAEWWADVTVKPGGWKILTEKGVMV